MEKCGKAWRREPAGEARHKTLFATHSSAGAGAACGMRACSACPGDYENPERTAWAADEPEEDESDGVERCGTEEFPAEE